MNEDVLAHRGLSRQKRKTKKQNKQKQNKQNTLAN